MQRQSLWLITLSFVLALALTVAPLPSWLANFRPEWVTLTLIYWCLALPHRVGIGFGWTLGLILDTLRSGLLGQHALALAVVAYITLKLHQQIRVFPMWQQAIAVFFIIGVYQLIHLWIKGIVGQPASFWSYWAPALTSMALWPWVFAILRRLRRRFHVT